MVLAMEVSLLWVILHTRARRELTSGTLEDIHCTYKEEKEGEIIRKGHILYIEEYDNHKCCPRGMSSLCLISIALNSCYLMYKHSCFKCSSHISSTNNKSRQNHRNKIKQTPFQNSTEAAQRSAHDDRFASKSNRKFSNRGINTVQSLH